MMVTVDVPPELAAKLTREAEVAGLSLDQVHAQDRHRSFSSWH